MRLLQVLQLMWYYMLVCSDLAVDLRMRMGDWFRVVQLLKTGGGAGEYVPWIIMNVMFTARLLFCVHFFITMR